MGTPIDGAGGRGFGVTGRGRIGNSLTIDKDGGQVKVVLGSVEGIEHNID